MGVEPLTRTCNPPKTVPQPPTPAHDHNRRAWDRRAAAGLRFAKPARDAEFIDPLAMLDSSGWLGGQIQGRRLLCLAAGGGKHGPLYAAAGAEVTVVDISPAMLVLDREVAQQRGLKIQTVATSMDDLSMLPAAKFDVVIHPVSTCYLPDIRPVFEEVARVMTPGGIYISQHKQPVSMQAAAQPTAAGYEVSEMYYRQGPLPPVVGSLHREEGTLEFLHRWEQIVGGMCRAGFVIEDLSEPNHAEASAARGEFAHRSQFVPPYVRIKARRRGEVGEVKRLIVS
jgi:SAM-dependent methyltransferase